MIKFLFLLLTLIIIISCSNSVSEKKQNDIILIKEKDSIHAIDYSEKVTCSSIDYTDGIMTHGFSNFKDVATIILKRYKKGSDFKVLLNTYEEKQRYYPITDSVRMERFLNFSQPINTAFDWQVVFSNKMVFNISDIKIELKPHFIKDRSVWWCEIYSFVV
ncbi:MAG: hypothetical protein ACXVDW_19305, partial [Bacteroidia bacterium]